MRCVKKRDSTCSQYSYSRGSGHHLLHLSHFAKCCCNVNTCVIRWSFYFLNCKKTDNLKMSIHITGMDDFKTKLKDAGSQLVIVDFYATWCGPCKQIAPKLEELANEFSSAILVLKVDVDECEEIATEYNINSMPTFIFIKNEKTIQQFSGANYEKLKQIAMENK